MAFTVVVLYPIAHGAAQVPSMTASRGADADVSRNATGLQARWEDGGSHAGLFLGGAATFDDLVRIPVIVNGGSGNHERGFRASRSLIGAKRRGGAGLDPIRHVS
jgi:hypothetical protein